MTFSTAVYAYPWDVNDDPAAAERIASLGAGSVVLAASYHSVRAATPLHPKHRVVEATPALYMPVRESAWAGRELVPASAAAWAGEESFTRASQALEAAGLPVSAWVVLTHNSAVGRRNPEVCVRNAFGDVYEYALCPAAPAVREFARTLAGEVARQTAVTSMVLEACGPLGISHLGHHEKTAGADWTAVDQALLSICFCPACTTALASAGLDVDRLAQVVRGAVGSGAASVEQALGSDAKVVLDVRRRVVAELRAGVVAEVRAAGVRTVSMHTTTDPWATGPAVAFDNVSPDVDCYVVPAWELTTAGADRVRQLRSLRLEPARIGAYMTALPPAPAHAGALATQWQSLLEAGAGELHIYHAGLASAPRLHAIRSAIAAVTDSTG